MVEDLPTILSCFFILYLAEYVICYFTIVFKRFYRRCHDSLQTHTVCHP